MAVERVYMFREPGLCRKIRKSSLLITLTLSSWLLILLYFNPRLLAILHGPESIFAKLFIIIFTISLDIFWFYTVYHLYVITFSYFVKEEKKPDIKLDKPPPVALLYTTHNDFREESVLSCLDQNYTNYHVFILDDSTEKQFIKKIDNFCSQHKDKVSTVRRKTRKGYKAGNINNGLAKIKDEYPYFSILDADTIIPKDFITKLLPYLISDSKLAYVQARQVANPHQESPFASDMAYNIELHYRNYLHPKNRFGFVMFYGHGGILRTNAWEEVGGFPEVATEDLAYSALVRMKGYHGKYVPEVQCYEDFPPTYKQFRKRNEKWVRGTTEFLFKIYPKFVKSKEVNWVEKVDVFACGLSLLLSTPFLLFIIAVGGVLPLFYSFFQVTGPMFLTPVPANNTFMMAASGIRYNVFWSWDFFILMMFMIFYPLLPVFIGLIKKPVKMFRYMAVSTFVFLSVVLDSTVNLIAYLITKKALFPVTGDTKGEKKKDLFAYTANAKWLVISEFVFSIVFFVLMVLSKNLWFISISLAVLLGVIIQNHKLYSTKWMKAAVLIPFITSLMVIMFIARSLL